MVSTEHGTDDDPDEVPLVPGSAGDALQRLFGDPDQADRAARIAHRMIQFSEIDAVFSRFPPEIQRDVSLALHAAIRDAAQLPEGMEVQVSEPSTRDFWRSAYAQYGDTELQCRFEELSEGLGRFFELFSTFDAEDHQELLEDLFSILGEEPPGGFPS